jgi:hypothetical protein
MFTWWILQNTPENTLAMAAGSTVTMAITNLQENMDFMMPKRATQVLAKFLMQ